ncbi:hypothetical protein DL991_41210 [Amycolatopsis sp. WAC 01375]|uniref:hypothetical protein n=1 Tax=Amycolatopsis sp. WAC 01375 TaxID=2203194 RepID=UPI000F77EFCC|nr:hypothetical protein [Amycolatopsis sp. WAC 01375]RSM68691.1 hypothetical protein DL991_41210 [Amycolatopsis sp. WAC 01375]
MIGQRVFYNGSIIDAEGRYLVSDKQTTPDGPRCTLTTYAGAVALRNVRAESITPVPEVPKHQVLAAQGRAQVVQGEFWRQFPPGTWLPYIHERYDRLHRDIDDLIRRNRPVEAEYTLLNAERFVGCISYAVMSARIAALVIAGDDESWL